MTAKEPISVLKTTIHKRLEILKGAWIKKNVSGVTISVLDWVRRISATNVGH
jgi:hypothetical protein